MKQKTTWLAELLYIAHYACFFSCVRCILPIVHVCLCVLYIAHCTCMFVHVLYIAHCACMFLCLLYIAHCECMFVSVLYIAYCVCMFVRVLYIAHCACMFVRVCVCSAENKNPILGLSYFMAPASWDKLQVLCYPVLDNLFENGRMAYMCWGWISQLCLQCYQSTLLYLIDKNSVSL